MGSFSDIAKRITAKLGKDLARKERGDLHRQPVELLPGMTAAPEPCLLPAAHWTPETHMQPSIAQPKIDGIRGLHILTRMVTRQAQPFDAALHCLPALNRLEERFGQPMVFDGEYAEGDGFQATLAAFRKGEGQGVFYLFDAVPYEQWKANRFTQPLEARLEAIERHMLHDEPFLTSLPPTTVHSAGDVEHLAGQAWASGAEGLVVKRARSVYARGRSQVWLKVKREQSVDGIVTDVIVADNDPKRAVVLVRIDGKVHRIAAMPPEVRELAYREAVHGVSFTGSCVEVEFNDYTDAGRLRGGKITRLRPDKD